MRASPPATGAKARRPLHPSLTRMAGEDASAPREAALNKFRSGSVQDGIMIEGTFPIEFIGGSRDGEVIEATAAPDYYEVSVGDAAKEIYERQTTEPPFVYVQIGYAGNETWT